MVAHVGPDRRRGRPPLVAVQQRNRHHPLQADLVVVDETDRGRVVTGMLTDRDLVTAVIAKDMDPRQFRGARSRQGDG